MHDPLRLTRALVLAGALAVVPASAAHAAVGDISTVAGTGTAAFSGDGGPAVAAQLSFPIGVAPLPGGGYLIADQVNNRVRRVDGSGTITTVAGTTAGFSGDGGPATSAQMSAPSDIAVLPDGSFLISDSNNNRIRKVSSSGIITTVAGTGAAAYSGDNGPATAAAIRFPFGIDAAPDGSYLIADVDNHRIRQVSPTGFISTVAGTGVAGYGGDGGSATAATARLNTPFGVSFISATDFLIADRNNHRIRKVQDGIISTVAGTGVASSTGDGGAAVDATLFSPSGVLALSDGGFLVSDTGSNRVRRVSPSGTIAAFAGTGVQGGTGDGGPATAARLNQPVGLALLAGGDVLIADTFGHRVRRVEVSAGLPTVTRAPGLQGSPRPGQTLTCVPGAFTNEPVTRSYVWELAPRGTTSPVDPAWQALGGETGTTYVVRPVDLAFRVRCREVAVNGAGTATAPSGSLRVDTDVPRPGVPAVTGLPAVGQTVTCAPGDWTSPGDFTFTWLLDGAPAATGQSLVVPAAARGQSLSCRVTGSNDVGTGPTADTAGRKVVATRPQRRTSIPISLEQNNRRPGVQRAACSPEGWTDDYGQYTITWYRDGALIPGADGRDYLTTVADLGKLIQCRVVSTNPLGASQSISSRPVLVPLPTQGTEGRIYIAINGQNWLSSTSMLAVSAQQIEAMRPSVQQRFAVAVDAKRLACRRVTAAQPAFASTFGRTLTDAQTCGVLAQPPSALEVTPDGVFWKPTKCVATVPYAQPIDPAPAAPSGVKRLAQPPQRDVTGFPICPKLNIDIPEADSARARERDASAAAAFAAAAPREILWDFDGNGRVDASCGPDAPILRTVPSRGRYPKLRAVLVYPDSERTGVYGLARADFDFSFGSGATGAVRSAQPFACRTSMDPPPTAQQPCITRLTIGAVRVAGNLCPVETRDVPTGELAGLDRKVRDTVESKVLTDPGAALAGAQAGAFGGVDDGVARLAAAPAPKLGQTLSAGDVAHTVLRITDPPYITAVRLDPKAEVDLPFFNFAKSVWARDQIYIARGAVKVNGVAIEPQGSGAATVLVPSDVKEAISGLDSMAISSSTAALSMLAPSGAELPIANPGAFKAQLEDRVTRDAQDFVRKNFNDLAASLRSKLDIGPFKFADGSEVKLEPDGSASIHASATLDLFKDPVSGKALSGVVDMKADLAGKLTLESIRITAGRALLGPVELRDLDVTYDGGLTVKGQIIFGPKGDGIEITTFRLTSAGRFAGLGLKYLAGAGRGIPIGPGAFLTQIGGEFQSPPPGLDPDAGRIAAYAAVSGGQSVGGGCPAVGLVGDVTLNWQPSVFSIDAKGDPVIACVPIGRLTFHADTGGYVSAKGTANFDVGPVKASGELRGDFQLARRFKDSRFQAYLEGRGAIVGLVEGQVKGIVSNIGVAGCGRVTVASVPFTEDLFGRKVSVTVAAGAGERFVNGVPPLTLPQLVAGIDVFTGCDLSDYSTFKLARATAGGGRVVPVAKGERLVSFALQGRGGVPRVKITTPGGGVLDYTNVPERLTPMPNGSSAMAIPSQNKLVILLAQPQPGNWKIEPADGSPALADLQTARALPQPKVRATVRAARGGRYVLRWSVSRIPGQSVSFLEAGPASTRQIATVRTGGTGKRTFLTGESSGAKTIVAAVTQDGLPRDRIVVARYRAPAPRVGRAGGLRARRLKRGRVRVTWRPALLASSYLVGVTYGTGRRASFRPRGDARSLILTGIGARERIRVRVIGESPAGRRGPGASIVVRAGRRG